MKGLEVVFSATFIESVWGESHPRPLQLMDGTHICIPIDHLQDFGLRHQDFDLLRHTIVFKPNWKLLDGNSDDFPQRLHDMAFVFSNSEIATFFKKQSVISIRNMETGEYLYQKQKAPA